MTSAPIQRKVSGQTGRSATMICDRTMSAWSSEFGVAGECGPFAEETTRLPMPPHRMNWHGQVLARGARKLGAHPFAPPIAINSGERDGRPACIYCGWCASGCPTEAKATSANTYLGKPSDSVRA